MMANTPNTAYTCVGNYHENYNNGIILPERKTIRILNDQDVGFGGFMKKNAIIKPMIASVSTQGNTPR
jgi:hypothetical protein